MCSRFSLTSSLKCLGTMYRPYHLAAFICHLLAVGFCGESGYLWTSWTPCSVTCGQGKRERYRIDNYFHPVETTKQLEDCFDQFCPGYLSWPRIHYSGHMVADVSTLNNVRCNYENEKFSVGVTSITSGELFLMNVTHPYYSHKLNNWNAEGTGNCYFRNTSVTSICFGPNNCDTADPIVGNELSEVSHAALVDLDVDWQYAPDIWGLILVIPGIMQAKFEPVSVNTYISRGEPNDEIGFISSPAGRYKSKLREVKWFDSHYGKLFSYSKELTMTFVIGSFNQFSLEAAISGTISMTSADDPLETVATRGLMSNRFGHCPFYFHFKEKVIALDLSLGVKSDKYGKFNASKLGKLDLGLIIPLSKRRFLGHDNNFYTLSHRRLLYPLTDFGTISRYLGDNSDWNEIYGGVMDIDLSHLPANIRYLMKENRLCIFYTRSSLIYIEEPAYGAMLGIVGKVTRRVNPGESLQYTTFSSFYGKPLKGVQMSLTVVNCSASKVHCESPTCNRTLASPIDALVITPRAQATNISGMMTFDVETFDPGNPRGCGLDGQIYPLQVSLRLKSKSGPIMIRNGGYNSIDYSLIQKGILIKTLSIAIKLYSGVKEKACPMWQDVKGIFIRYSNLYPAMKKFGIIDLHSYEDIKRRKRMLRASMFEMDISDPRYMPVTRDLSEGKRKLIFNWMECGMKQNPSLEKIENLQNEKKLLDKHVGELESVLQYAVNAELNLIAPYTTALLSLKTEFGRNKKVAATLQQIVTKKMKIIMLLGNIMNSINGKLNFTLFQNIPSYPGQLGFGVDFDLAPGIYLSLQPMSIGIAKDVFSVVEQLPDFDYVTVIHEIVRILDVMSKMECSKVECEELNMKSWRAIHEISARRLDQLSRKKINSISMLHVTIAFKLAKLDSSSQLAWINREKEQESQLGSSETIFVMNQSRQINDSQWYFSTNEDINGVPSLFEFLHPICDSTAELLKAKEIIEVSDLKSALQAILNTLNCESCFCDQTVTLCCKTPTLNGLNAIYHKRRLIQNRRPDVDWIVCHNSSLRHVTEKKIDSGLDYCYEGESVSLHRDGIWPIMPDPKLHMYKKGTTAHKLNFQFNLLYTRLLFCLDKVFDGHPEYFKTCVSIMSDIKIAGKKVVRTPFYRDATADNEAIKYSSVNCSPTWNFIRDLSFREGYPYIHG